jgi:hypothetical protein
VSAGDLIPSDLTYRDRKGEIYLMQHNPKQRWYYVPDMRADEVLLLKCYDSARDGRAAPCHRRTASSRTQPRPPMCCRGKASNYALSHSKQHDPAR